MKKQGALSGYRVLDLTDDKGMLCSRLLADMGAEVVRVEKPEPEIFKRLVKTADVLVESFAPGYLESLGLGYPELTQINPRLVMASVTAFGQSGPYRDYKSCDLVASALGGQLYVCGEPSSPPLKPFGNQSYYLASLFGAIGVLLALWQRRTSGRGQHIDISLQECVASALDHVLVRYFYQGVVAKRRGGLYWNGAFGVFPCKDGYVLLSLFHQWETLVEWLASEGMAEGLTDKKWRDRDYRLEHLDHVIEVLERWTKNHAVAGLVEKGQLMHFPWAEVSSIASLVNSPQLEARNFWVDIEHPETGKKYKFPGAPWRVGSRVPKKEGVI
jgi:crotonobetainyl-CoA:carnitine CoA-transferase CaiB-like acyl-CoA transferase